MADSLLHRVSLPEDLLGHGRQLFRARVGAALELTLDQDAAIAAIRADIASDTPMLRLLP